MPAVKKKECAANVLVITYQADSYPAAASPRKSKKHTTAASGRLPRRGNCKSGSPVVEPKKLNSVTCAALRKVKS